MSGTKFTDEFKRDAVAQVARQKFMRLQFYPAFWKRALLVQGVKYTFLFIANFTPINPPPFQHRAEAGNEGQVHRMFERVVFVAEAFIGTPVHALGLAAA
jgi:hypothetical protein